MTSYPVQSAPVRAAGFSLVEMLIALALGMLVAGAAFAILHSNQRSYQANQGLNRVQENARVPSS